MLCDVCVVCCVLCAVWCGVCCVLCVVCCVLCVVCCVLSVVCCVLCVVLCVVCCVCVTNKNNMSKFIQAGMQLDCSNVFQSAKKSFPTFFSLWGRQTGKK